MKACRVRRPILGLLVLIVSSLVLISCDAQLDVDVQQTVTIRRNEAWEVDMNLRFAGELVDELSSQQDLGPEGEMELLREYFPDLARLGVEIDWETQTTEFGDKIYEVHLEGEGLDTLKTAVFSDDTHLEAVEVEGRRRIVLSHPVGYPELLLRNYTLTLIGGEVISSNGQLIDDGSVRWVNPSGRIEAVITEKPTIRPFEIVLLGVACVGVAFLVLLVVTGVGFWANRKRVAAEQKGE